MLAKLLYFNNVGLPINARVETVQKRLWLKSVFPVLVVLSTVLTLVVDLLQRRRCALAFDCYDCASLLHRHHTYPSPP